MSKCTIKDLPGEIEKLIPEGERTPLIKQIIQEAKNGEFHDFKNNKYTCGKVQSYKMLLDTKDNRLLDLAKGIQNGDYDESPDEVDKIRMRKDWEESGSDIGLFHKMFGKND